MENLTPLEHLFLQLLAKLDDQQRQDVLRIMEAFVQSSKLGSTLRRSGITPELLPKSPFSFRLRK